MDELKKLMAELGITEEQAQRIVDTHSRIVESSVMAETEKGKGFYREKDSEALKLKASLKEKEDALQKALAGGQSSATTLETLKAEIEAVKAERDTEKQAREAEATKAIRESAKSKLLASFGGKVKMAAHVISGILADSEVRSENGEIYIGGKTADVFAGEFLKSNESDLLNEQRVGSGIVPKSEEQKLTRVQQLEALVNKG